MKFTPYQNKLVQMAIQMVNGTKTTNNPIKQKEDELQPQQTEFLNTVSKGLNEKEKEQLEAKIKADPEVVKHYKKRTMLKDVSTNRMHPATSFAFNVDYPARGFRDLRN